MKLVEQKQIAKNHVLYQELDNLCFLSKNLYNATLYEVRQHFFKTKKYLNYNAINKQFTDENQPDYRALPAKVSKMIQMLVDSNFKSFFGGVKSDKVKNPKIPNYLNKNGRQIVTYTKQALSFQKEGYVKLSKTNIYIKIDKRIKFVRIVPKGNHISLEMGYEKKEEKPKKNKNIASIDLGINNLITLVSNTANPLIINGKPLKSINQYYNKQKGQKKSILMSQGKKTSKSLERLNLKRNNKVKDYIHKSTFKVVNHLVSNQISKLVIGYNKGWKQDIAIGKRNNQNFVNIPFYMIVEQLKYKCKLKGIEVVIQEESYTSKCSFLDKEEVKKHSNYKGKRVKRGLFKSSKGILINADVNAALNILKKSMKKVAWDEIYSDLVEVSRTPLVSTINL